MTKRAHISAKRRLALFAAKGGICHMCKGAIKVGEAWDVSHVIPLELGGADDETNFDTAHRKCHRDHTATVDVPAIAKAKRREVLHAGAKAPSARKLQGRPFPSTGKRREPKLVPARVRDVFGRPMT